MTVPVEFVDAQVHANQIIANWPGADIDAAVEAAVGAMDALGVASVLVDEFRGFSDDGNVLPGAPSAGGVWRTHEIFAPAAVASYPDRFGYIGRVESNDPQIGQRIAELRDAPGRLALRITKRGNEVDAVRAGHHDRLFALAAEHHVPVFIRVSGEPDVLVPVLERHPELRIVIDHLGVLFRSRDELSVRRYDGFQSVIAMACYPNLYLKWTHVERLSVQAYPYHDVTPYLRAVVDAYGANRVMWASDWTQTRNPQHAAYPFTWSESLHYIRDNPCLSELEKTWILGRTVRHALDWPAASLP